jgi:hypothetical protein
MTEADWNSCTDPSRMVFFAGPCASDRRLRLLACAAARRVWRLLGDGPFRRAVETGERCADGLASLDEGRGAHRQALGLLEEVGGEDGARPWAGCAATYACWVVSAAEWEAVDVLRRQAHVPGVPASNKSPRDDLVELTANVPHFAALAVAALGLPAGAPLDEGPEEGRHRTHSRPGVLRRASLRPTARAGRRPWRRPAAPTRSSSATCAAPARTSAAAGRWTCCWVRGEPATSPRGPTGHSPHRPAERPAYGHYFWLRGSSAGLTY